MGTTYQAHFTRRRGLQSGRRWPAIESRALSAYERQAAGRSNRNCGLRASLLTGAKAYNSRRHDAIQTHRNC